jgi:hypothetical protein
MATEQPASPQQINRFAREKMTKLLHTNHIYTLDSYGWLDADTHDPEMVGHAMAQTDSLSSRFLEAAMDSPKAPELKPWEKALAISDGDFKGLMEAARLSIGLMLFQRDIVGEGTTAASLFDSSSLPMISVHVMSAMVFLGSASDRLRDFFIAAVFNTLTKQYNDLPKYHGKERRLYTTPFIEAVESLKGRPFHDSVAKLPPLTETIYELRRMRNEIVHTIATELARQASDLVNNPPSAHHHDEEFEFEIDWEATNAMITEAEAEYRERFLRPMRWYQLLIEASNHVFIIENMLRNRASSSPASAPARWSPLFLFRVGPRSVPIGTPELDPENETGG